jgi:hypothetical protein
MRFDDSRNPVPCTFPLALNVVALREKSTCSAVLTSCRRTKRVWSFSRKSRRPMKFVSGVSSASTSGEPASIPSPCAIVRTRSICARVIPAAPATVSLGEPEAENDGPPLGCSRSWSSSAVKKCSRSRRIGPPRKKPYCFCRWFPVLTNAVSRARLGLR